MESFHVYWHQIFESRFFFSRHLVSLLTQKNIFLNIFLLYNDNEVQCFGLHWLSLYGQKIILCSTEDINVAEINSAGPCRVMTNNDSILFYSRSLESQSQGRPPPSIPCAHSHSASSVVNSAGRTYQISSPTWLPLFPSGLKSPTVHHRNSPSDNLVLSHLISYTYRSVACTCLLKWGGFPLRRSLLDLFFSCAIQCLHAFLVKG